MIPANEKTGQKAPDDIREIRTITEVPAKLYHRGAVEPQPEVDKNDDYYMLYFLIGDAIEEDDKCRVPLEVGVDPNDNSNLWRIGAAVAFAVLPMLGFLLYLFKFKPKKTVEQ